MKIQLLKRIAFLLMLVFAGCNNNPEGFIIKGKLSGFKDSTMFYLYNPDLQEKIDSSILINGEFQFSGNIKEPQRLFINTSFTNIDVYKYTSLFAENSKISVKGDYDHFRYCQIKGSESHAVENRLVAKIKDNDLVRDSLTDYLFNTKATISESEKEEIWKKISILDSLNEIHYLRFIKKNINSYAALEKLKWRMDKIPKDTLRMYYNKMNTQFQESKTGQLINVYLNSRIVEVGEKYIDFDAHTLNGEAFKLSDVQTDYILLDFWASGCGPCRKANKELAKYYPDMKDRMEIVSFSLDVNNKTIQKASGNDGITWVNVTDNKGNASKVVIQYQISGIPCSYLINKDRMVIKKYVGFNPKFIDEIKSVISEN